MISILSSLAVVFMSAVTSSAMRLDNDQQQTNISKRSYTAPLVSHPQTNVSLDMKEFMWSTTCTNTPDYYIEYQAHFTPVKNWDQCTQFCESRGSNGGVGLFAEIPDFESWQCIKTYLQNQYSIVKQEYQNTYAVHHWAAAERGADGTMRWRSGKPMDDFDDFIANPGNNQYLHLQPANNYAWDTKNQEDDTNNGCLCANVHYF